MDGDGKLERREGVEALPSVSWRKWVTGRFRADKKWLKVNLKLNYRALRRDQEELGRRLDSMVRFMWILACAFIFLLVTMAAGGLLLAIFRNSR